MVPHLPQWDAVSRYGRQIDANRWYSNFGPLVCELESRLAGHFGGKTGSVLTVANATLGIALALQEVSVPGATACLMPSWTFVATAHAALAAGLHPVFADVSTADGMLTPEIAEAAIRTNPRIAAVVVVGPFGMAVPVEDWLAFRARTGIPVVIDAAAGFDTAVLSDIPTVVSLHATKPLGCGEGGLVMSTDLAFITRVMGRSNFGFLAAREATMAGNNAKMSEYHAAVALTALDQWAERRALLLDVAGLYITAVASRNWAVLQRGWGKDWISTTCNLRIGPKIDRKRLNTVMEREGIGVRQWWGDGCHEQPAFADCARLPLPVTADLAQHVIGLPFSNDLTNAQVERVMTALERALAET